MNLFRKRVSRFSDSSALSKASIEQPIKANLPTLNKKSYEIKGEYLLNCRYSLSFIQLNYLIQWSEDFASVKVMYEGGESEKSKR